MSIQETREFLESNGKDFNDIKYAIVKQDYPYEKYSMSVLDFIELSNFEYDNGYGGQEIFVTLVGEDFWLERGEYDGSEWWEFKTMPTEPKLKFKRGMEISGFN